MMSLCSLNSVCTDTLHLHEKVIVRYKNCNYDAFEDVRATQLMTQQKAHESTEAKRQHIQAFVDKNRASAAGAKMAQSRCASDIRHQTPPRPAHRHSICDSASLAMIVPTCGSTSLR